MSTRLASSVAWTPQYHGKYREVVLNNINFMGRKSRMVHQLASLVFTIPFNLRDPREGKGSAYPPEGTKAWGYLCKVPNVKSAKHGETRAALFFVPVFSHITREIKQSVHGIRVSEQITSSCNVCTILEDAFEDADDESVVNTRTASTSSFPSCLTNDTYSTNPRCQHFSFR